MNDVIKEMERYAEANNVPIIEPDSILFIKKYIKLNDVKKILEVGTAIGSQQYRRCDSGELSFQRHHPRQSALCKDGRHTGGA